MRSSHLRKNTLIAAPNGNGIFIVGKKVFIKYVDWTVKPLLVYCPESILQCLCCGAGRFLL